MKNTLVTQFHLTFLITFSTIIFQDSFDYKEGNTDTTKDAVQRFVAKLFQMDCNGDKKISFAQFYAAVQSEPAILQCFSVSTILLDDKHITNTKLQEIKNQGNRHSLHSDIGNLCILL